MRMFVGINPPEEVIDSLDAFLEPRREHAGLRWSDPHMFHITLAFCPNVLERSLDDFGERLAEVGARHTPFGLRLSGGGTFPDPDRAKLLYAAVQASEDAAASLASLSRGAKNAAVASGVEVDGGVFRPHLTVARSNRPFSAMKWLRVLDAYGGPTWTVDEIHLIKSHLGEGRERRPRYEVVGSHPLGQRRLN